MFNISSKKHKSNLREASPALFAKPHFLAELTVAIYAY
jgi:hypothetical protein